VRVLRAPLEVWGMETPVLVTALAQGWGWLVQAPAPGVALVGPLCWLGLQVTPLG
jgi:hypothetical protein